MQGWVIYVVCMLVLFYFGNWLIHWLIASDYDIHSNFAIAIFCITFGLSVMSLGLFIFEIMAIDTNESRTLYWLMTLWIDIALCIYMLPLCLMRKISLYFAKGWLFQLVILGVLLLLYLALLREMVELSWTDIKNYLQLITQIGTVMIGVLSGFGAVYCPWAYFQMVSLDINKLQAAKKEILSNITFLMTEIDKAATKLALANEFQVYGSSKKSNGVWGFIKSFFQSSNKEVQQRKDLKNEISQLREIHKEFFDYYKEYTDEEQRYIFSNTLYGKFLKRLAWIVFIYCIYKILITVFNLLKGRQKSVDPISRVLDIILPFFNIHLEKATSDTLAFYSSFIFMGYLMISNVRTFSLNLVNLFNSFMGIALLQKMPSDIMVYFLAEVFGVYLLSTVMLLQLSLPSKFVGQIITRTVNSADNILLHYSNFDKYFLTSGLVSCAVIYFNYRKRKQKLESFERQSDRKARE